MNNNHPPNAGNGNGLQANLTVADQFGEGFCIILTEQAAWDVAIQGLTPSATSLYFCTNPQRNCAQRMPNDSCDYCFNLLGRMRPVLAGQNVGLNLVHWGPNNTQHGVMLGPIGEGQLNPIMALLNLHFAELHKNSIGLCFGGND
jgi:hypothetical protein